MSRSSDFSVLKCVAMCRKLGPGPAGAHQAAQDLRREPGIEIALAGNDAFAGAAASGLLVADDAGQSDVAELRIGLRSTERDALPARFVH